MQKVSREDFIRICREERAKGTPWKSIPAIVGINRRGFERRLALYRSQGELVEQKVMHNPDFTTYQQTVYAKYDKSGNLVPHSGWFRQTHEKSVDQLRAIVEDMANEVRGKAEIVQPPEWVEEDHCNVVPWGDPHIGAYCWGQEAGDDFDLNIAESLMVGAIDELMARAVPASEGWLVNLGDAFHADDGTNSTPTNKHALDVDSRWPKIQQAGARIMRRIIERMLEKHRKVVVKCVRGNHDPHSGFALALILAAYYENDQRVEVDLDPGAFWYRSFGNTIVGVCHGHTIKKFADLPGIMAVDRPQEWGAARHRRWLVGHHHHSRIEEFRGCVVEVFRTLAPADAWAHSSGYRADRSLDLITLHREKGERARLRVFFDEVMK